MHVFRSLLLLTALLMASALGTSTFAQPTPDSSAFRVYMGDGTLATLGDVVSAMDTVRVVFLGEVHDDAVAHDVEAMLLRRAYERYRADSARGRSVALSLEMFERDVQPVLDEYLAGLITEQHFRNDSRPWSNYARAYRPLVEFARAHNLAVLAANAPRRYVNRVSRKGAASLGALPHEARAWLPPLPFDAEPSEAYRAKWMQQMQAAAHHSGETATPDTADQSDSNQASDSVSPDEASSAEAPSGNPHGQSGEGVHGGMNMRYLLEAQMVWDATMAYTLTQHLVRQPDALILHITGSFHVSEGAGTPDQVRRYRPGTSMLTIVMRPAGDITAFDKEKHTGQGDFVILTGAESTSSNRTGQSF